MRIIISLLLIIVGTGILCYGGFFTFYSVGYLLNGFVNGKMLFLCACMDLIGIALVAAGAKKLFKH